MELRELLDQVAENETSRKFSSLSSDSRQLQPGCIFVAVRGGKVDGHAFLTDASEQGARVLVVEDASRVPGDFRGEIVRVSQSRAALNQIASRFSGEPARKLACVGVTGTNGKTTTSHVVEAILNEGRLPAGVIGTIDHHLVMNGNLRVWKTEMTTPDPVSFYRRLKEFVDLGAKALAMEVSSHALHQARVDEVPFRVAIFTNLTRDHLDYHADMEDYFQAKAKLFTEILPRSAESIAVINGDDEYGKRLAESMRRQGNVKVWTYGLDRGAELSFRPLETGFDGTRFQLQTPKGQAEFRVRMPGLHNVYNAASAIGAGLALGLDLQTCARALDQFLGVRGRLESVPNKKSLHVFVDYAHTDDALRTILHYLGGIRREAKIQNRLITVFGCGGDRDRGKRPLMMRAAAEGSDVVVLTSDNPRTEDPEAILRDAASGIPAGAEVYQEVDRKKGIAKALEIARPGDVVVIAGKGHEDYQIIGTTRYPFSDVETVKEILG